MTIPGPRPGEVASIEFANDLVGPAGLGGMGAYRMTPFDHLHSIFASSNISPAVLEEALVMTGFDVDGAIDYIIETQPAGGAGGDNSRSASPAPPLGPPPPPQQPPRATVAMSGSRPLVVSRDSFDGYMAGQGGRGSPALSGAAQRWQPAAGGGPPPPTGDNGRGVGGRVCRYYLSGSCLRSDCRFSHDVGKAVCK